MQQKGPSTGWASRIYPREVDRKYSALVVDGVPRIRVIRVCFHLAPRNRSLSRLLQ